MPSLSEIGKAVHATCGLSMTFEPVWRKWCKIAVGLIDPVVSANAASSIVCAKIMQPAQNDFGNQLLIMQ